MEKGTSQTPAFPKAHVYEKETLTPSITGRTPEWKTLYSKQR